MGEINKNENKEESKGSVVMFWVVVAIVFLILAILAVNTAIRNNQLDLPGISLEKTEESFEASSNGYKTRDNLIYLQNQQGVVAFRASKDMEYVHLYITIYAGDNQVYKTVVKSFYSLNTTDQYNAVVFTGLSPTELLLCKAYRVTKIVYKRA